MEGELNITSEFRHFIQIVANQPCILGTIAEMGYDTHVVCETWNHLKDTILHSCMSKYSEDTFQVYDENEIVVPRTPMEKFVMLVILQSTISEVVDPPLNSEPADVIDFRTKKKLDNK